MGGAVSAGQNNEELVDNLCHEGYIHEPHVEKVAECLALIIPFLKGPGDEYLRKAANIHLAKITVFRMIDRADYMIFTDNEDDRLEAYEDHAWRRGTLHLSAPCIYTRALEALKLSKGVSFLNIGSGTGYLSTMAGFLIGPYGINHGIEIYPENIEYACEKLTEFRETSPWYDPVEFCEPLFVAGNGLLLSPGNILYDRIYCGAACPPEHAQLMKNMLNIGGILVMPHDNQLESNERLSQTEWRTDVVLPSVSFAPLILPSQESVKDLKALEIAVEPHSLKQYCRLAVLKYLEREKYHRICDLPLPKHLKEYVGHFKEWGTPCPPVKTLCPIDPEKIGKRSTEQEGEGEDSNKEEDNERKRRRNHFGGARPRGDQSLLAPSVARAVNINGRRVLLCSFNGITFQIPVESDESDNDHRNGHSSDEEDGHGSADEAHSDNPPPPQDNSEEGANGMSTEKERIEDSDSEPNHSNGEEEERGSRGGMDQSECSADELVDSMEQDGNEQSDSS